MRIANGVLNQKEYRQHGGQKFKDLPCENKLAVMISHERERK
jgi:hypothetical protein